MKVKPLRDRVFVKRDSSQETVGEAGLILRSDVSKEKSQFGTVVAIGEGYTTPYGSFIASTLVPGQRVMFPKHSGVDTAVLEKDTILIPESEILLAVEE